MKLSDALDRLRTLEPCDMPVTVRIVAAYKLGDDYGRSSKGEKRYTIMLARRPCEGCMIDTLIHEWGHCLAPWSNCDDHGPEFGVAYARAYTAVMGGH